MLFLINFYKFLERLCNHIGILALKKYKVFWRLRGLIPLHSEIYIVLSRYTLKSLNVIIRDLYGLCTRPLTDQLFHRYFPVGRLFMLLMFQIHLHRLLENTCGQFGCFDCKGNGLLCCFLLHGVPPSLSAPIGFRVEPTACVINIS